MAGFYEAIRHGYYAEENLEVRLDSGGFDEKGAYIDPVGRVAEGHDDFGIAGADVILVARAQGKPVVAIATIYQRSPVAFISLAEKNIVRPQDFAGKRITTEPPTTVGITYEALLKAEKVDRSKIVETPNTDYSLDPLFNDKIDVLPGFLTNEGIQAQRRGKVNLVLPSNYGINIYSNVIFTTEEIIKTKPEMVEGLLRATTRGMAQAVDKPEEAAQYVLDTYKDDIPPNVQEVQVEGMKASLPLLNPADSHPGMMEAENWEHTHQILLDQGLLKEPLEIEAAYTLEFLEKVYAK
jgi:NitT/TauT family transport system substrate-binding protein